MALGQRTTSFADVVRILLIVAAVIVVMLAFNVVFGFNGAGPFTFLNPDPGTGVSLPI